MAEDNNNESQGADYRKPNDGSSGNPFLTIVLVLNILILGGIAFMQYQVHVKLSQEEDITDIVKAQVEEKLSELDSKETGEAKVDQGQLFPIDPGFTANLAQGDGPRRYIRLHLVLKFDKNANPDEYKERKAQIQDTIISLLNTKRPEDLLKLEGKEYLKEEIKQAINTFMQTGRVIDIYYIEFQIN